MRRLLTAAALLVLAAGAQAQESWYDVEIIVFARTDQKYADSEVWPTELNPQERERIVSLKPAPTDATTPEPFQRLPESALRLTAEWQKLGADPAFEPLLYTGWRQPGLPREEAVSVRLGESDGTADAVIDGDETVSDASAAAPVADDAPAELKPLPRLEGTVRLVLSRYLHLETDLRYRTPAQTLETTPPAVPAADDEGGATAAPVTDDEALLVEGEFEVAPPPSIYLLRDSRRMRSRELHYMDHPMFGLLVQVTPYEAPKPPEQPAVAAPLAAPAKPAAAPAAPVDPAKGGAIRRN